jgi:cell division protein FtsN
MAKPASRSTKRGSSIFTGVLIGLIVGAILAVAVALWVTGNSPFSSKARGPAPSTEPAAPAAPEPAPSFDFYKVLPGDAAGELPAAQPPVMDAPTYYLQAGAFQNPDDADNLKAQLALLGLEAVIQTAEVADKGTLHRVRVGPLSTMDQVNRTRSVLTQNNIPATLVKELPNSQETP